MTTSRNKGRRKGPEKGSPSKAAGKRKAANLEREDSLSPVGPRKRHSVKPFDPSSDIRADGDTPPRPSSSRKRKEKSVGKAKADSKPAPTPTDSPAFAEMYTFTSSKPKPNGVIDLTGTPSPERRKASFSQGPKSFNPQQGPKKLVVKNLRTTPRVDPQQYLDKVWKEQDASLDCIFKSQKEPYSLEELYKGAENAVRQGKAPEMYVRMRAKCAKHLHGPPRQRIIDADHGATAVDTLRALVKQWQAWKRQLLVIRQIYYYMDQVYLLRSQEHPTIIETGYQLFRTQIFQEAQIRGRVLQGIIQLIDLDRIGCCQEWDLLKQSIEFLHELWIYTSDFEPLFKIESEKYFRQWRDEQSGKDDLGQYAPNATSFLTAELKRCDKLEMDRSTKNILSKLFDTVFIEEEFDVLLNEDSILTLLEDDEAGKLEQTYSLLQRKNRHGDLGPTFDKHVDTEGTLIVFDEAHEADMVINLLTFKRRLDTFANESFHKHDQIGNGMHRAFEAFMNKTKKGSSWDTDNAKVGEMIAKHIDLLLKGGVKAIPALAAQKTSASKPEEEHDFDDQPADEDAEINQHLADALDLFRFIHGKAVFEAFYKKDLARRLLMGRSASFDAERNMLTRLKNECGQSFTHNLESMFKDMDLAREEMMSYRQLLEDRGEKQAGPDLSVNVLSAAAWPTYPDVPANIPTSIATVISKFENHYVSKHQGRKLTWKHALAHCQVRARFAKGIKEIVVSGFQAIVLLLFNDVATSEHLSYSDLRSATGLTDADLKRTLQSLACAKYKVLLKHPAGRDVNESDTFTYNEKFTSDRFRIKINQIQLKETKEENKETHHRVAADRHYETQAAIVRIMKSRKKVAHNELIVEVIKATRSRGVLEQSDIRKNIEKLIEKEYMERVEGTKNMYAYVA